MHPTTIDKGILSAALLLLLATFVQGQFSNECPLPCKCLWKSGKRTADCKRQNLTELPTALSSETQSLDLSGNNITRLESNAFDRVRLVNLQMLLMRDCKLRFLNSTAFKRLDLLVEIDLSGNELEQLRPDTFADNSLLRVILLNRNRLQSLEDNVFHDLPNLWIIGLSDNRLVRISQSSFRNLPSLESLSLDGNNLTSLEVASFRELPKLRNMELQNNPWNCDCRWTLFRDWVVQRGLFNNTTTKCALPEEFVGRIWEDVKSGEMTCGSTTMMPSVETVSVETVRAGKGEKILKIDGSGPIIIIPRGNRLRLEWDANSTVLNFD